MLAADFCCCLFTVWKFVGDCACNLSCFVYLLLVLICGFTCYTSYCVWLVYLWFGLINCYVSCYCCLSIVGGLGGFGDVVVISVNVWCLLICVWRVC